MIDFGLGKEYDEPIFYEIKKKYPLLSNKTIVHKINDNNYEQMDSPEGTFTLVLDNMISFYESANEKVNFFYGYRWLFEPLVNRNRDILCFKIECIYV